MLKRFCLSFLAAGMLLAGQAAAGEIAGTVSTDGSTSMEKVIGSLGEAFENSHPGVRVTYNPTGSGAGIAAVRDGRCDIGLSSRELKSGEEAAGLATSVVARDGIAMIVNPENPVTSLSTADIAAIYTGRITNWREVGGRDSPISPIGREAGSGTRDGFETVTSTRGACRYRQELTSTGDVIASVSRNPSAIGYASLAAVKNGVRAIGVDGVSPTEKTVRDGSYRLQRPFLFVTRKGGDLSPQARAFLEYCASPAAAGIISSAGAVAPR